MNTALTVQDLFKLILFLLGIGAVTYLIIVLRNVNRLVVQIHNLTKDSEEDILSTMKQLPEISANVNSITKKTNNVLEELTPEINSLAKNINSITGKVESITDSLDDTTHKVTDTFDIVTDSISEAAYALQHNVKNVDNYIKILLEIVEAIKSFIKKKWEPLLGSYFFKTLKVYSLTNKYWWKLLQFN